MLGDDWRVQIRLQSLSRLLSLSILVVFLSPFASAQGEVVNNELDQSTRVGESFCVSNDGSVLSVHYILNGDVIFTLDPCNPEWEVENVGVSIVIGDELLYFDDVSVPFVSPTYSNLTQELGLDASACPVRDVNSDQHRIRCSTQVVWITDLDEIISGSAINPQSSTGDVECPPNEDLKFEFYSTRGQIHLITSPSHCFPIYKNLSNSNYGEFELIHSFSDNFGEDDDKWTLSFQNYVNPAAIGPIHQNINQYFEVLDFFGDSSGVISGTPVNWNNNPHFHLLLGSQGRWSVFEILAEGSGDETISPPFYYKDQVVNGIHDVSIDGSTSPSGYDNLEREEQLEFLLALSAISTSSGILPSVCTSSVQIIDDWDNNILKGKGPDLFSFLDYFSTVKSTFHVDNSQCTIFKFVNVNFTREVFLIHPGLSTNPGQSVDQLGVRDSLTADEIINPQSYFADSQITSIIAEGGVYPSVYLQGFGRDSTLLPAYHLSAGSPIYRVDLIFQWQTETILFDICYEDYTYDDDSDCIIDNDPIEYSYFFMVV